jgi:signal transduction histidine kinase
MTFDGFTGSRLAMLVEAAASVAGQTGLHQVLDTTVDTAMEVTGARYGALGVLGRHGMLVDFIHRGISSETAREIGGLPKGRGVLGAITRSGTTIRLDDVADHADSVGFPDNHPPMKSFLGVPVRVGGRVFGNLYLTDKIGGFTDEDEALVEALAVIAGSAVSTARLHERLHRVALVEERERIARELHDSVIQDLFAIGLSLQAASGRVDKAPDEVKKRLEESIDQLDTAISTLRRYIFDIRERMWTSRDLGGELFELTERLARPHDADVRLSITGSATDLPEEIVENLVQFAREAVNNALQHSEAPAIDVILTAGTREILVEIRDAGIGFDPGHERRGMGLDNMETRVDQLGGAAEILSAPGRGTVVRASIPLDRRS